MITCFVGLHDVHVNNSDADNELLLINLIRNTCKSEGNKNPCYKESPRGQLHVDVTVIRLTIITIRREGSRAANQQAGFAGGGVGMGVMMKVIRLTIITIIMN
jgi:hypothetical protein